MAASYGRGAQVQADYNKAKVVLTAMNGEQMTSTEATGKTWASAADIAKLIRRDIRAAIKAGDLPGTAKNYSVRSRSYSGGQAIDVVAKDLDGLRIDCPGYKVGSQVESENHPGMWTATSCGNRWCKAGGYGGPGAETHQVLSEEGQRICKLLQSFHRQALLGSRRDRKEMVMATGQKFSVDFNTNGAAFQDDGAMGPEIARILREAADTIEENGLIENKVGRIFDINGNRVGFYLLRTDEL